MLIAETTKPSEKFYQKYCLRSVAVRMAESRYTSNLDLQLTVANFTHVSKDTDTAGNFMFIIFMKFLLI